MERSIVRDARKSVGPIGRNKVAWLIGTRVAKTILASGPTSRIDRPDIWMQAIRSNLTKLLCHGGRPHMGPGSARALGALVRDDRGIQLDKNVAPARMV